MVRLLCLFEEDQQKILDQPTSYRRGSNYMSLAEYSKLIGERADQLERNFPIMIDIGDEVDPVKIAINELKQKKLPLILHREFPDKIVEAWDPNEMIIPN